MSFVLLVFVSFSFLDMAWVIKTSNEEVREEGKQAVGLVKDSGMMRLLASSQLVFF